MALQFIGTTGFQSGTGVLSFSVPSGTAEGDLLLGFVNTANQNGSSTFAMTGTVFDVVNRTGTGTAGAAGATDIMAAYKFWTSSYGTTITFPDVGSYQTAVVVAIRGVHPTVPCSNAAVAVDASATTTIQKILSAPSSGNWLCISIGLDRDTSANPYTTWSSGSTQGTWINAITGNTAEAGNGATTNAGTGGGIFAQLVDSGYVWTSGSFLDSTTHAYLSFYVNVTPALSVSQRAYRFYADGTESGSTALGTQDTAYTLDLGGGDANLGLRMRLQDDNVTPVPVSAWRVQWEKNSSGTWTNVATTGSTVVGFNSSNLTEDQATTKRLTGGTGSFVAGKVAEDGEIDGFGWTGSNHTEVLYSITVKAADLANGDTVRFRVVRDGTTTDMTYSQTPTLNITMGGNATFSTTTGNAAAAGGTGSIYPTDNTLQTTTGNAAAAGGTGALTGTVSATFSTTTGDASAAGQSGALKADVTLTTTTGSATAAGQSGSFTGTATFTTTTGDAVAAGETGALKADVTFSTTTGSAAGVGGTGALKADLTLTTTTGSAAAAGETGSMTGGAALATTTGGATAAGETGAITASSDVNATFETTTGSAAAAGGTGALTGTVSATFETTTGTATATGETGSLTGGASVETTTGDAAAAGGTGALTGTISATFTTTTGDATAAGETGALVTPDGRLTTTAGDATAAGDSGALTGGASISTTEGTAAAAGGTGALTADVTLATTTGDASAAGTSGSMTGTATFGTTTGDAAAGGSSGALTADVTLGTTTGDAAAAGGTGAFTGGAAIGTTTGDATAAGGTGSMTGVQNATLATTTGTAAAAGGTGAMTGEGQVGNFVTETGNATAGGRLGTMYADAVTSDSVTAYGGSTTGTDWVNPANANGAPNDTYATWTSDEDGNTSPPLIVTSFGAWPTIPAGATIDTVTAAVQHHESHTGTPIESVTGQAYLAATPLDTPTNFVLSLTDRDDTIAPDLTLAQLQGNTLAVRVLVTRTGA